MGSDAGRREGRCEKWLSVSWFEVVSAFEVLHDAEWLVIVAGLSRLSAALGGPLRSLDTSIQPTGVLPIHS